MVESIFLANARIVEVLRSKETVVSLINDSGTVRVDRLSDTLETEGRICSGVSMRSYAYVGFSDSSELVDRVFNTGVIADSSEMNGTRQRYSAQFSLLVKPLAIAQVLRKEEQIGAGSAAQFVRNIFINTTLAVEYNIRDMQMIELKVDPIFKPVAGRGMQGSLTKK